MAVIDLQHNHTGIQAWETKFGLNLCGGRGALTAHADGYTYCIFARNYQNGVSERRLYLTRTCDQGVTWADPIEITSGAWDDEPGVIPLVEDDPDSDLAVVFTRSGVVYRCLVDKETGMTSSIDNVHASATNAMYTTLIRTLDGGYALFYIVNSSISTPTVQGYKNSNDFLMNSWEDIDKVVFPANQEPFSLSVKRMLNGDLMLIASMRTALNGSTITEQGGIGVQNLPRGIMQTNVGIAFSSNDGVTWSSVQQLTSYAGNTTFNLNSFDSVVSADGVQLSDGRVVVAYEEHKAPQYLSSLEATGPTLPVNIGNILSVKYHESKNLLFIAADSLTNGGIFVFNLNTYASPSRILQTSTPYVWTNDINSLDISPDGTLLIAGSFTGGLNLIDISDADPTNWRTLYCLHRVTDPGDQPNPIVSNITKCVFADNNTVVFSYDEFSGFHNAGGIWRFTLDANRDVITSGDQKHTLTTWTTVANFNTSKVDFVVQGGKIVAADSGVIQSVSMSTGLVQYSAAAPDDQIAYCPRTNRFITTTVSTMAYYTDSGSAFSQVASFNATSNPAYPGQESATDVNLGQVKGFGLFNWKSGSLNWVSNNQPTSHGYRTIAWYLHIGEQLNGSSFSFCEDVIPGWLVIGTIEQLVFVNLLKTGRLRYGFFQYDAENKQLITDGVDFYDVCNAIKMSDSDVNRVHLAAIIRDLDDRLYLYCKRFDVLRDDNNFSVLVGTVEPDVKKFTARARIMNTYSSSFLGKSRIQAIGTQTLASRMRVSFAQCFKAKARIVPTVTSNVTIKACIKGKKSLTVPCTFDVLAVNRQTRCRLQFIALTGYTRSTTLNVKSYIAKRLETRMTGHFLVAMPPSGAFKPTWNSVVTARQDMRIRAWIVK